MEKGRGLKLLKSNYKKVARPERLELPTLWFEARCSIQLSYGRADRAIITEKSK